jgi:hypothetical protein
MISLVSQLVGIYGYQVFDGRYDQILPVPVAKQLQQL